MKYLLLAFDKDLTHARMVDELPEHLVQHGNLLRTVERYLGDADYLRDSEGQLIGFSYILGDLEAPELEWYEKLVKRNANWKLDDGMLLVFLKKDHTFTIECVQAVGTTIYVGPTNECMLAIPDWGFGKLTAGLFTTDK